MSEISIEVNGVGKCYRLGRSRAYRTLREAIVQTAGAPARWVGRRFVSAPRESNSFWALKDVSFQIKRGEVFGVIGRNGAGKSTLLKIISRITRPTEGRVDLTGRVGSLLEVGTGFHPELTGRENIYLNGAILGMSRREVTRKFEEIVGFSEVGDFLDTSVKHYSSGMYTRLAFAVAANLEPDILVVDEVLAVGDAAFQKKCLGKMGTVANSGRTVLFVSHNMGSVRSLCSRAIHLERGVIKQVGSTDEIIRAYMTEDACREANWTRRRPVPDERGIYFREISITDGNGDVTTRITSAEELCVRMRVAATSNFTNAQLAIRFTNQEGVPVFTTTNTDAPYRFIPIPRGEHEFEVRVPGHFLSAGTYSLTLAALTPREAVLDVLVDVISVDIQDIGSHATFANDMRVGVVQPIFEWRDVSIAGAAVAVPSGLPTSPCRDPAPSLPK